MSYIIKYNGGFFGGWNPVLGDMHYTNDEALAYRMRKPVAIRTLQKVILDHPDAEIISCA